MRVKCAGMGCRPATKNFRVRGAILRPLLSKEITFVFFCGAMHFLCSSQRKEGVFILSNKTRYLIYGAMFVAIGVLLGSFFRIQVSESIRISIAPAIVMIAGSILGPVWGAGIGFLTDFLSYIIANRAVGAYFPGYALTMALYGILAGIIFYQKTSSYLRITLSTIAIQTVCSLLLNTFWTSFMYGTPFPVLVLTRLPGTYISCVLYVVILCFFLRNREKIFKKIIQPV